MMRVEVPTTSPIRVWAATAVLYAGVGLTVASLFVRGGPAVPVSAAGVLSMVASGSYIFALSRSGRFAAWCCFFALVAGGNLIRALQDPPRSSTLWVLAAVTAAAGLVSIGLIVRTAQRSKELERVLSLEATSLAFFTTLAAIIFYALLEYWVGAPKLSMWWAWGFASGSWILFSIIVGRRYS